MLQTRSVFGLGRRKKRNIQVRLPFWSASTNGDGFQRKRITAGQSPRNTIPWDNTSATTRRSRRRHQPWKQDDRSAPDDSSVDVSDRLNFYRDELAEKHGGLREQHEFGENGVCLFHCSACERRAVDKRTSVDRLTSLRERNGSAVLTLLTLASRKRHGLPIYPPK